MSGHYDLRARAAPHLRNGLALVLLALLSLPGMASAELTSSADTYVGIRCETPGQVIEAGEIAVFDLTVTNTGLDNNKKLWYESFDSEKYDWDIAFMDGETEINKISLAQGGSKEVRVSVETSSDTPVGEYTVRLHIGDGWYWVYVTISETHAGEKGTLQLSIVDKDGEKIKGAHIALIGVSDHTVADTVMSTADGKISTDIDQGKYNLKVTRDGYKEVEKKDVRIKGGITTDAGTVMLEKAMFAAEITMKSSVITTTLDNNPEYSLTVKNIGTSDDTFRLGAENAPQGWYVRYQESGNTASDLSEIFISSGEEKALVVEAIPPYGTGVGDYNFTLSVDSSADTYMENVTAKIKGSYDLRVYADQYQYNVNKGDTLDFNVTLTNAGNAGTLTNVKVVVSAPDSWNAKVAPETIAGIPAGGSADVALRIVPPANIVASEYKITVKVTSDQTEKSDEFRIAVKEQSAVAIFGVLILAAICGGVYFMFRKYSRR
jgi:uncharacterized membrane protein